MYDEIYEKVDTAVKHQVSEQVIPDVRVKHGVLKQIMDEDRDQVRKEIQ